ncbi:DUF882 domain-containing protein [Cohaesibacter gelatinilyticus]|nr:DUF882 domain-containing protein [Cohaesibacter gelatinilyticus]
MARLNTTKDRLAERLSDVSRCPKVIEATLKAAMVAACTLIPFATTGEAEAANRSLTLHNTHTKETTTIVYKRNGRFDADGLRKLNRFLRDWRRNEIIQMDPALFDLIWQVYKDTGARKPIHVVSGYRSPATNNMLRRRSRGVAKQSRHTRGQAMDFYLPGVPIRKIREVGLRMQAGGVGYYPRSNSPFVHIDTGNVRHWPRMSRKQLARVFPRGNTVHVPTDGKPFKGYKQAKAKVARIKSQMARSSRSVARFTQVVKAAPSKSRRTQIASANASRIAPAQQKSNSFLSNLLNRTPQNRPTPAAAPRVAAPAPVELTPAASAAPFQLAALPKPRAPQPRPALPVEPAPIDLAASDHTDIPAPTGPAPEPEQIKLAILPKPRQSSPNAQRRFVLASGPKPAAPNPVPAPALTAEPAIDPTSTASTATVQEHLKLASLPQGSPERQEVLSGFGTVPPASPVVEATPAKAEDAIAQLAKAEADTDATDNRFSYAPVPAPLPRAGSEDPGKQALQLASLPNAKPLTQPQNNLPVPRPAARKAVAPNTPVQPATRSRDQLAKLTFSYGPASMSHFAHMKQSAQTATFARLSRPAPNNLNGLVAQPAHMIEQGFSHQPINFTSSRQFAGRAVAPLAIRRFN